MSDAPAITTATTFLDLPDDVILIIANMCADGSNTTLSVPLFSQIHTRFSEVIGDDFWKQWCRGVGYALPGQPQWISTTYRMLANLIDESATGLWAWEQNPWLHHSEALPGRYRQYNYQPGGTPVFPPQRIIDLDAKLEWEIVDRTLLQSLNMLYEQLLRKRASVNVKELSPFPDDFDLMALLCLGERRIRGGPCLTVDGNRLFSELCRLATSPALTGLVVSLEVYETQIASIDYTVMVTNGNGVTLLDVLFAIGQWLSQPLTVEQQRLLWDELQANLGDGTPANFSPSSSRYQIPPDASRTTQQAIEEQFMADHSFRMDLGRDLIRGGFYHCTVATTQGSILVRLT